MSDTTTRAHILREPSQLVIGMSHREMLALMADAGIFCSTDRFARILQDVQGRAIRSVTAGRCPTPTAEELAAYITQEQPK